MKVTVSVWFRRRMAAARDRRQPSFPAAAVTFARTWPRYPQRCRHQSRSPLWSPESHDRQTCRMTPKFTTLSRFGFALRTLNATSALKTATAITPAPQCGTRFRMVCRVPS
jgi:hypothetical protein